jgi:hypothetical protein
MRNRIRLIAVLSFATAYPARAFLGVADTSFVTVIANPAESANWAAELSRLTASVQTARSTLQEIAVLRTYAGDPRSAVADLGALSGVVGPLKELSSDARTVAELSDDWNQLDPAGRSVAAGRLLESAGVASQMRVFGRASERDSSAYAQLAAAADVAASLRAQVAREQQARNSIMGELARVWADYLACDNESRKQALLTKINELHAQDQVLDARRKAAIDELALADRAGSVRRQAAEQALDEQRLAESGQLGAAVTTRASAAQAQRLATLEKPPAAQTKADYSGLRLWTPRDAGP